MENWQKIAIATGAVASAAALTVAAVAGKKHLDQRNQKPRELSAGEKLARARKEGALIMGAQAQEAADWAAVRTLNRSVHSAENKLERGLKAGLKIEETGEKLSARIRKLGE